MRTIIIAAALMAGTVALSACDNKKTDAAPTKAPSATAKAKQAEKAPAKEPKPAKAEPAEEVEDMPAVDPGDDEPAEADDDPGDDSEY